MPRPQGNTSVLGGSDIIDVWTGTTMLISARNVALPPMELITSLERRRLRAQTPYKPDTWKCALTLADPDQHFCNIPDGLRFDFTIDYPNISFIQSIPT
jgi:hypothetical protein